MNIGTNIYMLRKEKKITQSQLAEHLGVSEQSVSKWENDQCAPDVSLFPVIADFFGVSIDRLFGYHMNSYTDEVRQILKAADDSLDTYKEIEIIGEGLQKYPNSPELKIYLAASLSMVNRISENAEERQKAVKKAVRLCDEVVDGCGDYELVDQALNVLARIQTETGNYKRAEDAIAKISAEHYNLRIVQTVGMLGGRKCFTEQEQFAENSVWKLYWTMDLVFMHMTGSLMERGEYHKAIAFAEAHEKLLSVFDGGCADFYVTHKANACERKAECYRKLGDREKCLAELRRFVSLAEDVKNVAKLRDFRVSSRNPIFFENVSSDIVEQYMINMDARSFLKRYDAFFGQDESWIQLIKKAEEQ